MTDPHLRARRSKPEKRSRMLMIALTVDHEIPETLARIMMASERLSTIISSAIDTGTLASAAIAALASSNLPSSANAAS